jgi:hypothetical protein
VWPPPSPGCAPARPRSVHKQARQQAVCVGPVGWQPQLIVVVPASTSVRWGHKRAHSGRRHLPVCDRLQRLCLQRVWLGLVLCGPVGRCCCTGVCPTMRRQQEWCACCAGGTADEGMNWGQHCVYTCRGKTAHAMCAAIRMAVYEPHGAVPVCRTAVWRMPSLCGRTSCPTAEQCCQQSHAAPCTVQRGCDNPARRGAPGLPTGGVSGLHPPLLVGCPGERAAGWQPPGRQCWHHSTGRVLMECATHCRPGVPGKQGRVERGLKWAGAVGPPTGQHSRKAPPSSSCSESNRHPRGLPCVGVWCPPPS